MVGEWLGDFTSHNRLLIGVSRLAIVVADLAALASQGGSTIMASEQTSHLMDGPVVEQKIDLRQQLELLRQLLAEQSETEEEMGTRWEAFGEALQGKLLQAK